MTVLSALDRLLADHRAGWGIGVFGALAEFLRDAEEAAETPALRTLVTPRGAIAIRADHPEARLLAWTEPSPRVGLWRQGAALCLPTQAAACGGADVVTELGPDAEALRAGDRGAVLFDLGLGFPHLRACVRTSDAWTIEHIRQGLGRPILERGNPVLSAVVLTSPHRIFVTRLARIEVFQPIPPPDGTSPEGPHTHFLPRLLAARRAHPATRPLPEGMVSCLDIFPADPLRDPMGRPIPFDEAAHGAFAALLARFGVEGLEALRGEAIHAIRTGETPERFPAPHDRFGRAVLRVAVRQLARTEPRLPGLPAWREAFDRSDANDVTDDPFHPD